MRFIDSYFYNPNFPQKCLSITLLPISLLYAIGSIVRRKFSKFHDFHIPIVSVGNLIAGGSGKTPFIIEIVKDFQNACVISRGYKRSSKGLVIVSLNGEIQISQEEAGDEPYLIARELKNASVIVSKNRIEAIHKAKELGAKVIFLDDGFRFRFKKLNIVLEPLLKPYFPFCLPSGIYREVKSAVKEADILVREGIEYEREVSIESPSERMLLLTAIANPSRLDAFLPDSVVGKITLNDHARFDIQALQELQKKHNATSLLVTSKDEVKLMKSGLDLSVMRLRLKIDSKVLGQIQGYVKSFETQTQVN